MFSLGLFVLDKAKRPKVEAKQQGCTKELKKRKKNKNN